METLVNKIIEAILEDNVKVDGHHYTFDSLNGSTDKDEKGRTFQDGKPVNREEFLARLKAQNDKIDNESDEEKGKRKAGFNKMMNNLK